MSTSISKPAPGVIRYDRKWFNPLYFHLRKYIQDPKVRKIMVYGGKASSKTFTIAQLLAILCHIERCSSICYRKEQNTIKTTLKESFKKGLDTTHMNNAYQVMEMSLAGKNGDVLFKGLDTEGKVKGVEGFKYLLFDELDHFTKAEWNQANASLRGIPGQKLLATWNPVDENIWIKQELDALEWEELPKMIDDREYTRLDERSFVRRSADGKVILIKTTYFDNMWMVGADGYGYRDQNLIDEYEAMKARDENWYNVNVLGEWGVRDKNKKFAWAFSKAKHVKDFVPALIKMYGVPFNPNRVVWLVFDFNVNPITCTAVQHYEKIVFFFKCFKLANSNTHALCDHITAYFKPGTVFKVTGDATGQNRNTLASDNLHNYQVIQRKLKLQDQQMCVPTVNPDIERNQVLTNAILNTYEVWIQPGEQYCDPVIYDLSYVEMDENKKMKKDRSSDKRNADFIDHVRYFFNVEFPNYLKSL